MKTFVRKDYKKVGKCGSGGNGKIEKYKNEETGEFLALKTIKEFAENLEHKSRDEVGFLKKLAGPGIVRLLYEPYRESIGQQKFLHLPLEFCAGGSLVKYLPSGSRQPLSPLSIQRIAWQVAHALKRMHDLRVCHRDLKADNVLLTSEVVDDALVKLCDFGEARQLANEIQLATDLTNILGMAPEMRDGRYDCKVDVWSLGGLVRDLLSTTPDDDCLSFIRETTQSTPASRPDITQALQHPYLQSYTLVLQKRFRLKTRRNMILHLRYPHTSDPYITETIDELSHFPVPDQAQLISFNQTLLTL